MTRENTTVTPAAIGVLYATSKGWVTYYPVTQDVLMRTGDGPVDMSPLLAQLMPHLARIPPYDLDNPPPHVPCLVTSAGEDALMEPASMRRKKEGNRR